MVPHAIVLFVVAAAACDSPTSTADSHRFTSLAVGNGFTCGVVRNTNRLICWGNGSEGGLGNGQSTVSYVPVQPASIAGVREVTSWSLHTCARVQDDALWCWGRNDWGQLGIGPSSGNTRADVGGVARAPVRVESAVQLRSLSMGGESSCALDAEGHAYCWGRYLGAASSSEFCTSSNRPCMTRPTHVAGDLVFKSISVGQGHICALATDGAAYCWGANSEGQLGTGTRDSSTVPMRVAASTQFSSISAGGGHTCAIDLSGVAYCWGTLATGTGDTTRLEPTRVVGELRFRPIPHMTGGQYTCGLTVDGVIYCWGSDQDGALGDGPSPRTFRPQSLVPVPVKSDLRFDSLYVGANHACALTSVGDGYCWGIGTFGELGNGKGMHAQ